MPTVITLGEGRVFVVSGVHEYEDRDSPVAIVFDQRDEPVGPETLQQRYPLKDTDVVIQFKNQEAVQFLMSELNGIFEHFDEIRDLSFGRGPGGKPKTSETPDERAVVAAVDTGVVDILIRKMREHADTPRDQEIIALFARNSEAIGGLIKEEVSYFNRITSCGSFFEHPIIEWFGPSFHKAFRQTDVCTKKPNDDSKIWEMLNLEPSCFWPAFKELLFEIYPHNKP
jgi:hypothetical protein